MAEARLLLLIVLKFNELPKRGEETLYSENLHTSFERKKRRDYSAKSLQ